MGGEKGGDGFVRLHVRVWGGLWRAHNWLQLARFGIVGFSGYAVNLAIFGLSNGALDLHHLAAATLAFLAAVTNNFFWNRRWKFVARGGRARWQAARFLFVSTMTFVLAALVLDLLVRLTEVPALIAQASSIAVVTPLSFIGNKVWTFRLPEEEMTVASDAPSLSHLGRGRGGDRV
jgi:putative flippase GtrA